MNRRGGDGGGAPFYVFPCFVARSRCDRLRFRVPSAQSTRSHDSRSPSRLWKRGSVSLNMLNSVHLLNSIRRFTARLSSCVVVRTMGDLSRIRWVISNLSHTLRDLKTVQLRQTRKLQDSGFSCLTELQVANLRHENAKCFNVDIYIGHTHNNDDKITKFFL